VDHDFQNAVITVYLRTDDYRAMKALTVAASAEAERLFAGLPVKARVGGGVTNAIALNETMVRGKTINLIQISILVVVITSLLLRSLAGGLLVLLPLATSALVNLGLMGWTGIPLSMGTAAISAMAVGIGADYAVYFIFRVREEFQRCGDLRQATATALTTSGKAIAYVASAVAGGYLCLTFSGFKVHVLLGVLVALTMVTSSAATVAFLPSVLLRVTPRFLKRK
jgi:predicted RND superfamily exporter protein